MKLVMDSDSILDGPTPVWIYTMNSIPGPPVTSFEELNEGSKRKGCFLLWRRRVRKDTNSQQPRLGEAAEALD